MARTRSGVNGTRCAPPDGEVRHTAHDTSR